MPVEIFGHCAVSISSRAIFIHGGFIHGQVESRKTFKFIYEGKNSSWTQVEHGEPPCRPMPYSNVTQCGFMANAKEIVVSSLIGEQDEPCTAVYNVEQKVWKKSLRDGRETNSGGEVIT